MNWTFAKRVKRPFSLNTPIAWIGEFARVAVLGAMVALFGGILSTSGTFAAEATRTLTDFATISDSSGNTRLLFHWTPTVDATNFVVRKAVLRFDLAGEAEPRFLRMKLHPVTASWDAATVAWDRGWSKPGGDFNEDVYASADLDLGRGVGPVAWDITSVVKDLLSSGEPFEGFLVTVDASEGEGFRGEDAARLGGLASAVVDLRYRKTPPIPREIAAQESLRAE